MEPKFKYFKCALDIEPINSLMDSWTEYSNEKIKKVNAVLSTIPFAEGWWGSKVAVYGIASSKSNPELLKIQKEIDYILTKEDDKNVWVKGNNRTKAGKDLNEKIQQLNAILQHDTFNHFALKQLNLRYRVNSEDTLFMSACGVNNGYFLITIPVKSEGFGGDNFPDIPAFLTEIKQSEFLALQGK